MDSDTLKLETADLIASSEYSCHFVARTREVADPYSSRSDSFVTISSGFLRLEVRGVCGVETDSLEEPTINGGVGLIGLSHITAREFDEDLRLELVSIDLFFSAML